MWHRLPHMKHMKFVYPWPLHVEMTKGNKPESLEFIENFEMWWSNTNVLISDDFESWSGTLNILITETFEEGWS